MKKALRLFFSIAILILGLLTCISCNKEDETSNTEASPIDSTEVLLLSGGKFQASVTYEHGSGQGADNAAFILKNKLEELFGTEIPFNRIYDISTYDKETVEIVVGNTTAYEETGIVRAQLDIGEYAIQAVGHKIIVLSCTEEGLLKAVERVVEMIDELAFDMIDGQWYIEDTLTINETFGETGTVNECVKGLPIYDDNLPTAVMKTQDTSYMAVFEGIKSETYASYCEKLKAEGFEEYSSREVKGNKFSIFTDDSRYVYVSFTPHDNSSRVIAEYKSGRTLPFSDQWDNSKNTVRSTYTMMGTPGDMSGLSVITQLGDGSYIIFDGGYRTGDYAKLLYEHMWANKPSGCDKIVIAAWIITHDHGDHSGAAVKYMETESYISKTVIERFIWNIPADEYSEGGSDQPNKKSLERALAKLPDTKIITAHAGQHMNIRNAELEILMTYENIFPEPLSHSNNTSTIYSLTIDEKKLLMLGDEYAQGCDVLADMYGDYLKSDFMNAAHHGYSNGLEGNAGGTGRVYTFAKPQYVFWCGPTKDRIDRIKAGTLILVQSKMLMEMECVINHHYSFDGTATYYLDNLTFVIS